VSPFYVQRVPLDNASLLARRVYAQDLDLFDQIYRRERRNLKSTIARVIALARSSPKEPYGALREWLGRAGATPGR
jgi:predicted aminopeptidase